LSQLTQTQRVRRIFYVTLIVLPLAIYIVFFSNMDSAKALFAPIGFSSAGLMLICIAFLTKQRGNVYRGGEPF